MRLLYQTNKSNWKPCEWLQVPLEASGYLNIIECCFFLISGNSNNINRKSMETWNIQAVLIILFSVCKGTTFQYPPSCGQYNLRKSVDYILNIIFSFCIPDFIWQDCLVFLLINIPPPHFSKDSVYCWFWHVPMTFGTCINQA